MSCVSEQEVQAFGLEAQENQGDAKSSDQTREQN